MEENTELITSEEVHEVTQYISQPSPVTKIEAGLSDFISDTFKMVKEEDDYQKEIQAEMIKRLPTLKNSEIIALATSQATNQNDMISKVVSPTMGLLTSAQQAEMARQQKEIQMQQNIGSQTNMKEININANQEVLSGMKALMDLMNVAKEQARTNNQ